MLRVLRNTYPRYTDVPHAEPGDLCSWTRSPGRLNLVRQRDGQTLLALDVRSDGRKPDGEWPKVTGVIAAVKSRGWVLELCDADGSWARPGAAALSSDS